MRNASGAVLGLIMGLIVGALIAMSINATFSKANALFNSDEMFHSHTQSCAINGCAYTEQ